MVRSAEQWLARRAARRAARLANTGGPPKGDAGVTAAGSRAEYARAARSEAKDRIAHGGPVLLGLQALTMLMKLDVVLFGRVRSGPFFALLEKRAE